VILASGSRYRRDGASGFAPRPLSGAEQTFVHGPEEIIRGEAVLSGKIVVIDDEGYHTGVGVAEMLAAGGAQVELISRKQTVGASLGLAIGYVAARLRAHGAVTHDGYAATVIGDHTVTIFELMSQASTTIEDVDYVVITTMREAIDELYDPLESKVPYVYLVGDALAPRNLRVATYEGHRFGRVIGDPNMPASVSDELFAVNKWHQLPAAEALLAQ
jgi:2,4-dienoyl-CoA reductase (NADPH2)